MNDTTDINTFAEAFEPQLPAPDALSSEDVTAVMRAHVRSQAVLVAINIKRFDPHRSDRAATAEYCGTHGVDPEMANMSKRIIPREFSQPLQQLERKIRNYVDESGLPFYDRSFRLLPVEKLDDFMNRIQDFQSEWDEEVKKFLDSWPDIVAKAREKLNGMFDARFYPPVEVLEGQFSLKPVFMEIPDDRWTGLPDSVQGVIEASMVGLINERIGAAHAELRDRMVREVTRLRNKMADWSDSSRLHKSSITRVTELADNAAALNVFGDDSIQEAASAMSEFKALESDPSVLRDSSEAREIVKAKADRILAGLKL